MTYSEALAYIHSLEKFGINPGLERISDLCGLLGNPQDKLKYIHVAGTNGKGSTSTMISEILQEAGLKTGLYTSPYVIDFCERIQINSRMISHDDIAAIITEMEPIITGYAEKKTQPTEFEVITAAAFLYFSRKNCDIVVLETGLGGRYDATNIIKQPIASVITSISLDHMALLGDTIKKIAAEKCGIIKQNTATVSYPEQPAEAMDIIRESARNKKNTLFVPSIKDIQIKDEKIEGTNVSINGLDIYVPFMGRHMVLNAAVAVTAAKVLADNGLNISNENIVQGIAKAKMPARMEIFGRKNLIIMDGGHNEGCAKALAECINKFLLGREIIAVCGMMADKDYNTYLKITAPYFKTLIAVKPVNQRSLDAEILAEAAKKYCKDSYASVNSQDAFQKAVKLTAGDGVIIICGSFYLASELRKTVLNNI